MPRLLFEKTGNAIWISHLDLMRVFQRSFQRAGLPLTHTKGFNPRPSVSIALPLSVGIESRCELLDFDLEGDPIACEEICRRLNEKLIAGVKVLQVYEDGAKIKHLSYLDCVLQFEYDGGIPEGTCQQLEALFGREELNMEKKSKTGKITQQNVVSMIRSIDFRTVDDHTVSVAARICCQNPTLNPMQIPGAIEAYLPQCCPDFVTCRRVEIYDENENIFR